MTLTDWCPVQCDTSMHQCMEAGPQQVFMDLGFAIHVFEGSDSGF